MAATLKAHIKKTLAELVDMDPDDRIHARIEKYSNMGHYKELT